MRLHGFGSRRGRGGEMRKYGRAARGLYGLTGNRSLGPREGADASKGEVCREQTGESQMG